MVAPLILIGGAYLLLKKDKVKPVKDTVEDTVEDTENVPIPQPTDEILPDTWTATYFEGNDYVWKYGVSMGLAYDDGSSNLRYEYYWFVGNADHTTFARTSKPENGGHYQVDGVWAKAYADEQAARAAVDAMNEGEEEPDDEPAPPTLPTQPDFGLGNNWGYTPNFGGI